MKPSISEAMTEAEIALAKKLAKAVFDAVYLPLGTKSTCLPIAPGVH